MKTINVFGFFGQPLSFLLDQTLLLSKRGGRGGGGGGGAGYMSLLKDALEEILQTLDLLF